MVIIFQLPGELKLVSERNDKMEKIVAVCAIVLLAAFGYVVYTDSHTYQGQHQDEVSGYGDPVLCYSLSGDDYVSSVLEGYMVGKSLASVDIKDVNNNPVTLVSGKKTLIAHLYGEQPVEEPILKEWAKTYGDQLQVIASFPYSKPGRQEIKDLTSAGVIVVTSEELIEKTGYRTAFLNPKGQIVFDLYFDIINWKRDSQLVEQFVKNPDFHQDISRAEFNFSETFTLPKFTDALGKTFNLEDFRGKPVLLFLANPYHDDTTASLYPFISNFKERYGDKVNIVVVMDYHINSDTATDLKEYYEKYKLSTEDLMEAATPEELLDGQGLDGLPIYFDQNGLISDLCDANAGLIILDKDLKLVNVTDLYSDYVDEQDGVGPLVESELKSLIVK